MSDHKRKLTSKASTAKLMWALSVYPFPLTVRECTEVLGLDPAHKTERHAVSTQLQTLHSTGLVLRRQVPGAGAPFEYVVNPGWTPESDTND